MSSTLSWSLAFCMFLLSCLTSAGQHSGGWERRGKHNSCTSASWTLSSIFLQRVFFFHSPYLNSPSPILFNPICAVQAFALGKAAASKRSYWKVFWVGKPFSTEKPKAAVLMHLKDNVETRKSRFLHRKSEVIKRSLLKSQAFFFFFLKAEKKVPLAWDVVPFHLQNVPLT